MARHHTPKANRFGVVFPALLLNYFGQGALVLRVPDAVQNPFYLLASRSFLYPLVAIATLATVVASQALISGAFSLRQQCVFHSVDLAGGDRTSRRRFRSASPSAHTGHLARRLHDCTTGTSMVISDKRL